MPFIDTHAHVFLQSLPMAANRRYTPNYDAPTGRYLHLLADHDMGFGVIVQPSFLGIDNRYLLAALRGSAGRLRAIAVVAPEIGDHDLEEMDEAGVVGIRFNTIGRDIDELAAPAIQSLARRIAAHGWQIEVQARAADLPAVFRTFADFDGPLVIDHFGLPDPALGIRDPGFAALLREGDDGRTYVKISASYRCGKVDVRRYADALLAALSPDRLLWGSDWPWTQFEPGRSYGGVMAQCATLIPEYAASRAMDVAAMDLFRFSSAADYHAGFAARVA